MVPVGRRGVVAPRRAMARGPFIAVVLVILAAGLLGLLLVNTVIAQGSFHLHALQVSTKQLADREQGLQREVDAAQAPAALAAAAATQGMVPAGPPVFLRLPDGAILGDPTPALAPTPAPTAAPTPAPTAAAAAKPAATTGATTPPAATSPATTTTTGTTGTGTGTTGTGTTGTGAAPAKAAR